MTLTNEEEEYIKTKVLEKSRIDSMAIFDEEINSKILAGANIDDCKTAKNNYFEELSAASDASDFLAIKDKHIKLVKEKR